MREFTYLCCRWTTGTVSCDAYDERGHTVAKGLASSWGGAVAMAHEFAADEARGDDWSLTPVITADHRRPYRLTGAALRAAAKRHGYSARRTEHREWRIAPRIAPVGSTIEACAYYATDIADAYGTLLAMSRARREARLEVSWERIEGGITP